MLMKSINLLLLGAGLGSAGKWDFDPDRFPSVWFGANVSGPETDGQHLLEAKYASVYFGWQQGNAASHCHHEEAALRGQIQAVRKVAPSASTVAYGANAQSALTFYDWQLPAIADRSLFLPAAPGRRLGGTCANGDGYTWDWRNPAARDFFVDKVIRPWADEPAVDGVFVDEGDAVQCRGQHGLNTTQDRYDYSNGSVAAYRRAAQLLAAKGKRLILSLKNGFAGAAPISDNIGLCPVPLDAVMDALMAPPAAPFVRYHEYWGVFSPLPKGATMCTNLVKTAVEETQHRGVALSAHGGSYPAAPQTSLKLAFALFMLTQSARPGGHSDYFGWSTGDYWLSKDWRWNDTKALYTHRWGSALGPATESADGVFHREYQGGNFSVDCNTLTPAINAK